MIVTIVRYIYYAFLFRMFTKLLKTLFLITLIVSGCSARRYNDEDDSGWGIG